MCDWVQIALFLSMPYATIQSECSEPTRFYDNKYCRAIPSTDPRNPCPEQFRCDDINRNARRQSFYAGRHHQTDIHEEMDYAAAPSCETTNYQYQTNDDSTCDAAKCPFMSLPDDKDCYFTYSLDQCCATGYKCRSNSTDLFRCNVEGTQYYEGQIFAPPNAAPCKTCVCNRNWRGRYDASVCSNVPCPMELWHRSKVMDFCAPVYYSEDACCPSDFLCPTRGDERSMKIFKGKRNELHCRFGRNLLIRVGTKTSRTNTINGDTTFTKCECKIPPYMTCYRTFL